MANWRQADLEPGNGGTSAVWRQQWQVPAEKTQSRTISAESTT
jgi:hypothetical protein